MECPLFAEAGDKGAYQLWPSFRITLAPAGNQALPLPLVVGCFPVPEPRSFEVQPHGSDPTARHVESDAVPGLVVGGSPLCRSFTSAQPWATVPQSLHDSH